MTLKISRFLTDAIAKQAKISHFDYNVKVGAPSSLKQEWREMIMEQFGDLFLNDANYVIMVKVDSSDDKLKKKFSDLVSTVLDTEVPVAEIKLLDVSSAASDVAKDDDDDDEEQKTEAVTAPIFLIKVTTK